MILRRHAKPIKNHAASAYPQLGQRNGIGARQKRFRSRLKERAANVEIIQADLASPVLLSRFVKTSTASSRFPARLCVNQRCRCGPASKCWVRWQPRLPDAPTIRTFTGLRQSLFRFFRKRTQIVDRALRTLWLFGDAHSSAMVLHEMAEADPLFFWHDFCEVGFDFVRIGLFGEA